MEQAMFEALNGVGVYNQTALALQYLFGAPTALSANGGVAEEEEDLFQCGKCKEQFSSFSEFFTHKKSHNSVQLEPVLAKEDRTNGLIYSEITPKQQFSQPITLSESEFLSLSMDQGSLNIAATTSQVLDGCDSYLPNSDQEQSAFPVQAAAMPQEVTLATSCETFKENVEKSERIGANTITVSVVGAVNDPISGDVRNGEIPKDPDNSLGKVKCVYCGKSFTKNYDLQQHVRSHTGERPFQCVVCGRAFAQKSNVKKHMATHKVWPKRIRTLSVDPVLPAVKTVNEDSSLPSESDQNPKNISIVDQNKTYVCQYCPALFKNYCELKSHRKVHTHQKVYRCFQKNCNETFSDLDSFLGHTQTHENEAQYHCHVCNKQFKSLDELGTHQYSHNVPTNKLPPRVVSCKKCKIKFANLEGLERHLVLDNHTYPCPQCGKVFSCERFLRRHLATHSSVLPYVCQHCSKAFKTEQYLNMHVIIHSNEKPFACQLCSAAFNRRDKLTRHNLIHETVRKFKCPFRLHLGCTKAFNRKDKLRNHMFTHSTTLKFLCENCGCIFEKEVHLVQHKKKCSKNSLGTSLISTNLAKPLEKTNDSKNVIEVLSNNMSTIEIVVVPVSGEQTSSNDNGETFRVTFPATKPTPDSVDVSQTILTADQEVPVYKPLNVASDL